MHPSRCSGHSARTALLVRVLTPVPFESLIHVVVTRQCLLPLVHETGNLFCFLHHLCVARLPAHQRSCPCTVAVELRQSVAPSGCSWRCNAPVCWRLLTCIRDCPFGQTFCNFHLFPASFKLQWRIWYTVLHCVAANALESGWLSALRHAAPESAVRVSRSMSGIDVLAEYAGSPHQFSSKPAELTRQLSAPRSPVRISSVRVTRFLFPPSQNPSDVAFKLLTMLTFLNTVLLPDSVSTELRNFLLAVSLHTLTSTLHEASPLSSTPSLGTLRFASLHSLAPQASSFLLDVTPIRHFVDVDRSLSMPWKGSTIAPTTFLFCVRILFLDSITEDLKLDVCSSSNSSLSPSMHALSNCTHPSPELHLWGNHKNHAMFLGIVGLMFFISSMKCIWCTLTVFIRILDHAPLLPTTQIGSGVTRGHLGGLILSLSLTFHTMKQILVLHWLVIGIDSLDWRWLCAFTLIDSLHNLLDMADLAASSFSTASSPTLLLAREALSSTILSFVILTSSDLLLVVPSSPMELSTPRSSLMESFLALLSNSSSFSHRSFVLIARVGRFERFGLITLLKQLLHFVPMNCWLADLLIGPPTAPVYRGCPCRDPPVWWLIQAGWWVTKAPTLFCCSALGFCCAALSWGWTTLIALLTCSHATLPNLTNAVYSSYDAGKSNQIETWLDVTCMAGKLNWSWHAPSAMRVHFRIHNRAAEVFSRSSTRSLRHVSVLLCLLVLWGSRASWFAPSPVPWLPSPCWWWKVRSTTWSSTCVSSSVSLPWPDLFSFTLITGFLIFLVTLFFDVHAFNYTRALWHAAHFDFFAFGSWHFLIVIVWRNAVLHLFLWMSYTASLNNSRLLTSLRNLTLSQSW